MTGDRQILLSETTYDLWEEKKAETTNYYGKKDGDDKFALFLLSLLMYSEEINMSNEDETDESLENLTNIASKPGIVTETSSFNKSEIVKTNLNCNNGVDSLNDSLMDGTSHGNTCHSVHGLDAKKLADILETPLKQTIEVANITNLEPAQGTSGCASNFNTNTLSQCKSFGCESTNKPKYHLENATNCMDFQVCDKKRSSLMQTDRRSEAFTDVIRCLSDVITEDDAMNLIDEENFKKRKCSGDSSALNIPDDVSPTKQKKTLRVRKIILPVLKNNFTQTLTKVLRHCSTMTEEHIFTSYFPANGADSFRYMRKVIGNGDGTLEITQARHVETTIEKVPLLFQKNGNICSTLFGAKYPVDLTLSMRCISVPQFGGVGVMKLIHGLPTPKPQTGQVLVNVKTCGINPVDTYIRSGNYKKLPSLPYTPGKDGAGIVSQLGESVSKFSKGDQVWFYQALSGSSAEFCLVDEDHLFTLPVGFNMLEGAAIGTPYMTAYRALFHKSQAKSGETVLIHGASGGVGTAVAQFALAHQMRVLGTAGSEEGRTMLREMGCSAVYDHRTDGYVQQIRADTPDGPDIIIEMLANVNLSNDLQMVKPGGRVVVVGSRGPTEMNARDLMVKECSVTGVMLMKETPAEAKQAALHINEGLQKGWLKPRIWKTFELEQISDAHTEIIQNSGAQGQIVLSVKPTPYRSEFAPETDT